MENDFIDLNIKGEENISIMEVMNQIPDNAIRKFYTRKINNVLIETLPLLISIRDIIDQSDYFISEKNILESIITDVYKVFNEDSDKDLSETPILPLINVLIKSIYYEKSILTEEQLSFFDESNLQTFKINCASLLSISNCWIRVESKIREGDLKYLYVAIENEEIQQEVLLEIKDFYESMF